jgi:ESAT-6 family protein
MTTDPGLLNIRYETLGQAQNDLGVAYDSVTAIIKDLTVALNSNLAEWSGSARDVYQQVQVKWQKATDDMAAVLRKANVHLGNANEMYQAMERSNTTIWTNG